MRGDTIRACVLVFLVGAGAMGCGGGGGDVPNDPNDPGDGTTPVGTIGGGGGGGGKCNSLDLGNVSYINDLRGGAIPTMSGGALADGTYYLTKYEWHNAINALHMRKTVMVISGGQVQWAAHRAMEKEVRLSGSVSTSGTTIDFSMNCPGDEPLGWDEFTVSGDWLVLHDFQDSKTATFTRQ